MAAANVAARSRGMDMDAPKTNEAFAGKRTSRAGAGQRSTEISDSKSAGFEVDGVGRWPLVGVRLRGQVAAIGSKDRWHHQDMQDSGQRWRRDLDRLVRQRHVGRVLMAQHRLGGIHAFTGLACRHCRGHRRCIGHSGTDIARQRQLREQQRDHDQEGRSATVKSMAGHVRRQFSAPAWPAPKVARTDSGYRLNTPKATFIHCVYR